MMHELRTKSFSSVFFKDQEVTQVLSIFSDILNLFLKSSTKDFSRMKHDSGHISQCEASYDDIIVFDEIDFCQSRRPKKGEEYWKTPAYFFSAHIPYVYKRRTKSVIGTYFHFLRRKLIYSSKTNLSEYIFWHR